MYRCKSMFRLSGLLAALCLSVMISGCGRQLAGGPADLVPEFCHNEYGVGLLFVTIVNRGNDAGPSTMTITYKTASPLRRQVRLQVKTPGIAAGNEIWLAVELPAAPGSGGFIRPVGMYTITADAMHVLREVKRADQTHLSYCEDGR